MNVEQFWRDALKIPRPEMRYLSKYIIGPARRVDAGNRSIPEISTDATVHASVNEKGTGGTNAMMFLKGVRDLTAQAVLKLEP